MTNLISLVKQVTGIVVQTEVEAIRFMEDTIEGDLNLGNKDPLNYPLEQQLSEFIKTYPHAKAEWERERLEHYKEFDSGNEQE